MGKSILVEVCESCPVGELIPAYDTEADILAMGSNVEVEWTYGIDIDGRIIVDMTSERIVTNVDLLIRKSLWEVKEPLRSYSPKKEKKSIRIFPESVEIKSFSIPLDVFTNPERNFVHISLDKRMDGLQAYSLSKGCTVLLDERKLAGFQIWTGS